MTEQQQGVITLIRSAIDGKYHVLPEKFELRDAVSVALKHGIIPLVYYGAINCGIDKNCQEMTYLFNRLVSITGVDVQQNYEIDRVCRAFEENGIDYLPMKGTLLKAIYPKSEMRIMGDADILIRTEQYELIKPIMLELGYEFQYESNHELVWKRNLLCLELHKRVMTSYNKDFYSYYGDGWSLARKTAKNGTRYEFSDEDFYIYMFVHFTKHYRACGIGIKHLVDIWVYRQAKPELDDSYIVRELTKMQLCDFHQNILDTLAVWFAQGDPTDKTDYITEVIFSNGEYGVAETADAVRILRESKSVGSVRKAKSKAFFGVLFLPYKEMCIKYPVLYKMPVLLPFCWVLRWVNVLLFKRNSMKKIIRNSGAAIDKKVAHHQQALNFVGLDFNFEE